MINFSKNSVLNLKSIDVGSVRDEVQALLIDGEAILQAFQTVRDQIIFTTKRIITIDVKGITGKRKEFSTLPYSKIQFFSIQTPGLVEIFPDCEMELYFTNGFKAVFEFKGKSDVVQLGKVISGFVLN